MNVIKQAAELAGLKVIDYNLKFSPSLAYSHDKISHMILHHDVWQGGTMEDIHRDHIVSAGYRGTGYHVRIRIDGSLELGRPFGTVGGHCKQNKMNYRSIGLVFEGNFDKQEMNRPQFEAGYKFIAEIMKLTDIKSSTIQPHNLYANKSCPGQNFDIDGLLEKSLIYSRAAIVEIAPWAKRGHEFVTDDSISEAISNGKRPLDNVTRQEHWVMSERLYERIMVEVRNELEAKL